MGDLREELEKAFEAEGGNEATDEENAAEGSADPAVDDQSTGASPDPEGEAGTDESGDAQPESEAGDQDASGDTAAEKAAGEAEKEPEEGAGSGKKAEKDALDSAPHSWSPAVREHWSEIPKAAREVIVKREGEILSKMEELKGYTEFSRQFNEVIRPFEALMAAQGVTALEATKNLMTTSARLTMGTAQEKAAVVKEIIDGFGVDIGILDGVLAGEAGAGENAQIAALLDQRLAPIQNFMQQQANVQRQQYQTQAQEVNSTIEQFYADPKNEFAGDVASVMADLMEAAANRGQEMSLEKAYESACYADPEIRKILVSRERAAAAKENAARVSGKKAAASSISGSPGGASSSPVSKGIRGDIENAWDALQEG